MADYKIRILRIYSCCCLKNKMIITVKICLNFALAVINTINYGFYCICMIVRNLYSSVCAGQSHNSFNANLFFFIKLICTGKAEDIRCIERSVSIAVKVTVYIFYKRMLNKEIKTCNFICTNGIAVNIIY